MQSYTVSPQSATSKHVDELTHHPSTRFSRLSFSQPGLFSTFQVIAIEGEYFVSNQPDSRAFTVEHFFVMAGSGIMIAVFTIGMPAGMYAYLAHYYRAHRSNLMATNLYSKFGFLYEGYHPNRFWWEGVTLVRRMLLLVAVLFGASDAMAQSCAVLAIIVIFILMQAIFKPFESPLLNKLQLATLSALFFLQLLAMLYATHENDESWSILITIATVFVYLFV